MVSTQPGRWVRAVIAAGIVGATCLLGAPSALAQEDPQAQARLEELRATIKELQDELDKVKSDRSALQTDLEAAEGEVRNTRQKVRDLRQELQNHQTRLKELDEEKEALSSVKKHQQGSVGQHVNAAYQLGQQSPVKLLLNQQDPARLSRNLKYYDYLIAARAREIESLNGTLRQIDHVESRISETATAVARDHKALMTEQISLEQQQAQRKQTLTLLEQTISTTDDKLRALEDDRRNLEKVLERVVAVAGDFDLDVPEQPFTAFKGKLPWPAQGKVVQKYGAKRINKMTWQGMLIRADEGSPVHAVHHGQVIFADYLRGQGLLIIVDHGGGYMSLYAHNQLLLKQMGEWVNSGEQIATVGQSGGQADSALYFELRFQGKPTNPASWLSKA